MKLDWKAVVGILLSVALIWWTLRDVAFSEVAAAIAAGNFLLLIAAIFVATTGYLLRAVRWKFFLEPFHRGSRFGSRFAAVNIGFMLNNLLPARAGEFGRALSIHRLEPVGLSGAISSLVVERFLDAIAIVVFLFIALMSPSVQSWGPGLRTATSLAVWATGIGVIVATCFVLFPTSVVRIFERLAGLLLPERWAVRAVDVLEVFLKGFRTLRDPALLVPALVWTFVFWAYHAFSFWLGFRAFGIEVGFEAGLLVSSIVAISVGIPSAPGFFGTFHAAATIALAAFGAPEVNALAFAYAYHLGGFIPITVIGLFYAWKVGFSFKDTSSPKDISSPGSDRSVIVDIPSGSRSEQDSGEAKE